LIIKLKSGSNRIILNLTKNTQIIRHAANDEKYSIQYGPFIMTALTDQKEYVSFADDDLINKFPQTVSENNQIKFEKQAFVPLYMTGKNNYQIYFE